MSTKVNNSLACNELVKESYTIDLLVSFFYELIIRGGVPFSEIKNAVKSERFIVADKNLKTYDLKGEVFLHKIFANPLEILSRAVFLIENNYKPQLRVKTLLNGKRFDRSLISSLRVLPYNSLLPNFKESSCSSKFKNSVSYHKKRVRKDFKIKYGGVDVVAGKVVKPSKKKVVVVNGKTVPKNDVATKENNFFKENMPLIIGGAVLLGAFLFVGTNKKSKKIAV